MYTTTQPYGIATALAGCMQDLLLLLQWSSSTTACCCTASEGLGWKLQKEALR
jgi:hypothetical protein